MKILIATGGSLHSEVVLRYGAQIAERAGATPTVLTVIRSEAERPQANAILLRSTQLLQPLNVQTRLRIGQPAEEIIREAQEGNYNLVVLGEPQRHHPVARLLLGSTTDQVLERDPCPVIIAKGRVKPIQRILLCDSGLEQNSLPGRFSAKLGGLLKSDEEITILHVMSQMSAAPGVRGQQLRADAQELIQLNAPEGEWLKRDIQLLEQFKVHPRPKVRHGLVVDEIVAEAQEGDYDLVVIGAHGGEGWRRILLEDLAHEIIVHMDRPVLVVR